MDKLQAKYMKLSIDHTLLKSKYSREMRTIFHRAEKALGALEKEIIWLRLQEGNNGVPSHVLEVNKQLKFVRDLAKEGTQFESFAMEPAE